MAILTKKQQELLFYLKKYISDYGMAPTLDEIAKKFHVSKISAQQRVSILALKGFINKVSNKPRSITIKEDPEVRSVTLPILGRISAGEGVVVFEESSPELIEVPVGMINSSSSYYILQVDGTSMINEGIMDKDYVIIRQQSYANSGDIVVAITNDSFNEMANLKKFIDLGSKIKLVPSNHKYLPKIYDKSQVIVRGKYCGLIRKHV